MARLIDADELSKNVYAWARDEWNAELLPYWVKEDIEVMIESAPTVDAVEVVRCKDCKYYWKSHPRPTPDVVCLASSKDDAFCSEGERREDETD